MMFLFWAKACMINWSYTLACCSSGVMLLISMFHLLHVSHSEVSHESVAQRAILSNGTVIKLVGYPSSSRRASMDVVKNSPVCVSDASSSHSISRWVNSWLYHGYMSPFPPCSLGPNITALGKCCE